MSMHTRLGAPVTIIANCGHHQPPYLPGEATLVQVQFPKHQGYQWAEFLKADEGWAEIEAAIEQAPKRTLTAAELIEAFNRAE